MLPKPKRARITIPGTGKVVDLRKAREAMVRREAWLGVSEAEMAGKLRKQFDDFEMLGTAVDAWNRTKSFGDAARASGVSRKTAGYWVRGERLPRNVSFRRAEYYLEMRRPLKIRPGGKADFAYVLGTMAAHGSRIATGGETKEGIMWLGVRDKGFAKAFAAKLKASTAMKTTVRSRLNNGQRYHVVEFGSRHLLQLFNELTDYGKRVPKFRDKGSPVRRMLLESKSPVSFLDTREERRQFVKALFDGGGNVRTSGPSRTKVVVLYSLSSELMKFASFVLLENGFHPKARRDGTVALPSSETVEFMKRIGFSKKVAA